MMDKIEKLNKYKEYIRQCTFSPNSAENYSDFKRLNILIANRYQGFTELLDYDDPDYLQSIYDDLDKLNSFDEFKDETNAGKNFKRIGGGQYHNALLNYIRFLRAIKLLRNHESITEKSLELKSLKSTVRESFIKYWNIIDQHGAQFELYVNKFESVLNDEIKKLKIGVSDVFEIVDFKQYVLILNKIISNNTELSYLNDANGPDGVKYYIWSTNRHYRNYLNILAVSNFFYTTREEKNKIVSRFSRIVSFDKNLLTAMRTKPFLLLAGISGTGKSRIIKQIAFESCPKIDQLRSDKTSPGNYQLIEVKPNWHDSTEVLGYESAIANKYIVTPFVKFLVKAMCYPDLPFFVCMDEMNLAPVEQYFAEFLSVLESRKLVNGTITSEPLIKADIFKKHENQLKEDLKIKVDDIESTPNPNIGTKDKAEEYGKVKFEDVYGRFKAEGLRIPSNLIVVGTVNMDETTHQFSRKVIDRAMTIEMNIADSEEPFNNFFAGSNELDYLDTPLPRKLFLPTVVQANEALDRLSEEDKKLLVSAKQNIAFSIY
ncbi:MAG: hypothetical protein J6V54_02420 [Bacteroidales bacterium]|nr:hypothetical protein [Bacteroidales bacterium]